MAALRLTKSKSLGSCFGFSRNLSKIETRVLFSLMNTSSFHSKPSGFVLDNVGDKFNFTGFKAPVSDRVQCCSAFSTTPVGLSLVSRGSFSGFGGFGVMGHRLYSSKSVSGNVGQSGGSEVGVGSGGGDVGDGDWVEKVKGAWKYVVDAGDYAGEKVKEVSNELTPYGQQLLDANPYLKDVVVPVGWTLTGTMLAWFVMPKVLRRFHKFSTQGPAQLLSGSSLWGPVPYENSFWGALEDPLRYLVTFMAFSQIANLVAPTTIASQYLLQTWRGAVILSVVWFLHRWKTNVITRALASKSTQGLVDRDKLLVIDKISSVGLFSLGLMALAEACGVAVQSILTVGGIGGVATAFASKDILGNVLSGLSVQMSQPFSVGDTIRAGSVEGQVVEMGLTTTRLLSAEKFPVIVPNSLFSSQVIVNKSRAEWRAMLTKIPLHISDFDKIPQISDDITNMIKSNSNVFLEREVPYCFLSRVEKSYAELTLGYNLKHKRKDLLCAAEQDILLKSVQIIKQHGATLGSTFEDMNGQ